MGHAALHLERVSLYESFCTCLRQLCFGSFGLVALEVLAGHNRCSAAIFHCWRGRTWTGRAKKLCANLDASSFLFFSFFFRLVSFVEPGRRDNSSRKYTHRRSYMNCDVQDPAWTLGECIKTSRSSCFFIDWRIGRRITGEITQTIRSVTALFCVSFCRSVKRRQGAGSVCSRNPVLEFWRYAPSDGGNV